MEAGVHSAGSLFAGNFLPHYHHQYYHNTMQESRDFLEKKIETWRRERDGNFSKKAQKRMFSWLKVKDGKDVFLSDQVLKEVEMYT